ncbi:hypothetical protein H4S01_006678, partial [Coemansia sp. RSA 2610]
NARAPQHDTHPRNQTPLPRDPHSQQHNGQHMSPFKRKLVAAQVQMPASIIPTLYIDCSGYLLQHGVLRYARQTLAQGGPDGQPLKVGAVAFQDTRLAVQPCTWDAYDMLLDMSIMIQDSPCHWYQASGRPVRIIAGSHDFVELPIVECALREIGEVRSVNHGTFRDPQVDGDLHTDEFTATLILAHDDELPDEIVLRGAGGLALQLEQ